MMMVMSLMLLQRRRQKVQSSPLTSLTNSMYVVSSNMGFVNVWKKGVRVFYHHHIWKKGCTYISSSSITGVVNVRQIGVRAFHHDQVWGVSLYGKRVYVYFIIIS